VRRPRVVIYDDDDAILSVLKIFFSRRGYEVCTYLSPVICSNENRFDNCGGLRPCADIILSDYKMPGMTGIELFQHQALRDCPLDISMKAIMSGYSDNEIAVQCKDLGVKFIRKPFTFFELSDWLGGRERLFDLSEPLNDRRANNRQKYSHYIEYRVHPGLAEEIHTGLTIDRHAAGIGLITHTPLHAGDKVEILRGVGETRLGGIVRWCTQEGETCKAGLSLLHN
jgi:FixJ family two-component response regulator